MRNVRLMLVAAALFASACGSNPPPRVAPLGGAPPPRAARHDEIATKVVTPAARFNIDLPIPQHPSVGNALTVLTTTFRNGVQDSLLRSAPYQQMIESVFAEYHLPRALACLPMIESAYSQTLTSRAGARGIWQFMTSTAREYGLRVDDLVDERADAERSTRAAAAYLQDLYRQFHDWPLALAAYNAGPTRIRRAMMSARARTFWDLLDASAIPAETRGYVPSFYAAITIAADPIAYGFRPGEAVDPGVRRIEIEGPVSLRAIAEAASLDEAALRSCNPAYQRGIVPPGRATIVVPAAAGEIVLARASALRDDDATFAELSEPPLIQQHQYEVKKGDTMYSIARRFELTVDELRDLNGLAPDCVIHPGDKLIVASSRSSS